MLLARALLVTLALGFLAAPLAADAQPPKKVGRIGVLISASTLWAQPLLEAFRQELRTLGYVEGQNLVIEQRSAEGQNERLPALAAENTLTVDGAKMVTPKGADAPKAADVPIERHHRIESSSTG